MAYASVLYACCIAAFFYPVLGTLSTALIGPPEDNMQDLWNAWHAQNVLTLDVRLFFFTRDIFFPEGTSLLYHSFSYVNLFWVFVLHNLLGLTLDINALVVLNNVMILLSFYFAAIAMFYLALEFTDNFICALVAGYIFAFSPFHFAHSLHHLSIATIQFIPLFVLCSLRQMQRPSISSYIGSVLFFTLGALSSWYYLVYNGLFLFFYAGYDAVKNGAHNLRVTARHATFILAGGCVLLSPLMAPMIIAGIREARMVEISNSRNINVADLLGFFVFHPYHLLSRFTDGITDRFTGNLWEMSVYLGLVNMALLTWAIKKRKALQFPALGFCLSGMSLFMLLAGGRLLHVLGKSTVPLPTVIMEYLPFISHLRTPSRAIVYAYLFLAIAIATILNRLCFEPELRCYQWQRNGTHRIATTMVIFALTFLDFYSVAAVTTPVDCPKAYDTIRQSKIRPAAVLDLPASYRGGNRGMMYQICHRQPIVHASISRKLGKSLIDFLEFDELGVQKKQLINNGVKYIVVHKYQPSKTHTVDLHEYAKHYRTEYSDENYVVFSVGESSNVAEFQ